jgi:hypothetical protein
MLTILIISRNLPSLDLGGGLFGIFVDSKQSDVDWHQCLRKKKKKTTARGIQNLASARWSIVKLIPRVS